MTTPTPSPFNDEDIIIEDVLDTEVDEYINTINIIDFKRSSVMLRRCGKKFTTNDKRVVCW